MPQTSKAAPPKTIRAAASSSVEQQVLDELGIRPRIAFPFSPGKATATLHFLAEIMSSPMRIEHPLLRLKAVMAVLWIADVRHFQAEQRPITGTRWQAYPQGPVPTDIIALINGDPVWLAELPETEYAAPFEIRSDCIARNLRVRFAHDPKKLLSPSERETLKKAVATGKDLKRSKRQTAMRGEAYQLTPLYQDIPWELMLAPKMRTKDVIAKLAATARNTAL
jgi:Protein of unknown function (DUF4065)